ncbi:MAG: flagellar basal body rod protein FlgC [Alteromonadaceae bacterium]|nr:flagellar basal body rod protein FlgC [Alteromonadaceae bacterium]
MSSEALKISELGMRYEQLRLEAAAINIANANVIQNKTGAQFSPLKAQASYDVSSFEQLVKAPINAKLEETQVGNKLVFKPKHPMADEQGYIRMPQINMVNEMVSINSATRAYEANVKVFNASHDMARKALEIGRR